MKFVDPCESCSFLPYSRSHVLGGEGVHDIMRGRSRVTVPEEGVEAAGALACSECRKGYTS